MSDLRAQKRRLLAPWRLAVLALSSVLLTACQSEVTSQFRVSADGVISETVTVVLHDEAAKSTLENIEVAKRAVAYQTGVAEGSVQVTGDAERLEFSVDIPEGVSVPASGVLDVAAQVMGDEVWFRATLGGADALRAALLEAVSAEQDAEALSEAMRRSVEVCVKVQMSGEIRVVSDGVMVNGANAELCRGLEDWTIGEMELHAERSGRGDSSMTKWYLAGGAAIIAALLLDRWRRKRTVA